MPDHITDAGLPADYPRLVAAAGRLIVETDPIAIDTAEPRHDGDAAARAFDKFEQLLRAAAPDMDPFVRCDIACAAIDYGTERAISAIHNMAAKLRGAR